MRLGSQACLWDGKEAPLPCNCCCMKFINYSQQTCLTDETEKGWLHKMQFCSQKNGLCRILADVCEMYWGLFLLVVRSIHCLMGAETFPSFPEAKPLKINLGREERNLAHVTGPGKTERGHGICRLHPQSTKHPDF